MPVKKTTSATKPVAKKSATAPKPATRQGKAAAQKGLSLKFNDKTSIADICKAFNKEYPYIRLEFCKRIETYLPDDSSLAPIDKTVGQTSKKAKGTIQLSIDTSRKALDVINEFEKLYGLHVIFSYYRYDWYADVREPVRMGCIFEPEDDNCFKGSLKELEAKHKKSGAIPNCW